MSCSDTDPLTGLSAFVCCAESGSFTRAGLVLGLTPSAVSKSMTRLEGDLGVRLFQRSPRAVTLTAEGAEFYARCKELVENAFAARDLVASMHGRPWGSLRVCAPVSFGQFVLSKALGEWLMQFPEIRVNLVLSDRVPDLTEERIDIAVRLGPPPDSRVVAQQIGQMPFVTVATPAFLAQQGTPQHPEQLRDYACLGYLQSWDGGVRQWTFGQAEVTHTVDPHGPLCSGHASVLLDATLAGVGLAQLPRFLVAQKIAEGELQLVLADYVSFGPPLYAIYAQNRYKSATIQAFLSFLNQLSQAL